MKNLTIRPIEATDNAQLASVIRKTLEEFGANKPGTVYFDESTDHLFELFEQPNSAYFVALLDKKIVGGAGVFPTPGLPDAMAELVKMYLAAESRGQGIASQLIEKCEAFCRTQGFSQLYLETLPELKTAVGMYQHLGFQRIEKQLGESGHFFCSIFMTKKL